MSRRYHPINWNDCDAELQDLLEDRCVAKLAGSPLVAWDDLTSDAQVRITQACMAEIEAGRRESFDEAVLDEVAYS